MKVVLDEENNYQLALNGQPKAVWECYAHDYDDAELFNKNLIRLLNQYAAARGWLGWAQDMAAALFYGVKRGPRELLGKR